MSVVDLSKWMEEKWPSIKDIPLWQISIPSSHDSLALEGAAEERLRGNQRSAAQGLKISGQLETGIRHFDIRLEWSILRKNYYGFHGTDFFSGGQTFDEVFVDFRRFLDCNTKEIVILRLRLSGGDQESAINHLISVLGAERIAGKSFVRNLSGGNSPAGCTPAELAQGKKQIILMWEENAIMYHDLIWWNAPNYFKVTRPENHGSTEDVKELIEGRTNDLKWWMNHYQEVQFDPDDLAPYWWALGFHTTCTFGPGGLRGGAQQSIPPIIRELTGKWRGKPINLAGADLFSRQQYEEFSRAVIESNSGFSYRHLKKTAMTGPFTKNPNGGWARWSITPNREPATGIEIRNRNKHGLIDARILYGSNLGYQWTTGDGNESQIRHGRGHGQIIEVVVKEQGGYGIIDLMFKMSSGYESGWLVGNPEKKNVSFHVQDIPTGFMMVGLQGKQEGTDFGLVDLRLATVSAAP